MSDQSAVQSLVADLAKTHILIDYLRVKAPNVAEMSAFSSEVTQGLKDQAQKNGGISPFAEIFEKAKELVPGVAAEGFAKAQGFVEYISKEAPDAFNQVKNIEGDILGQLQAVAPVTFEGAQKAGDVVARFVSENGPQVLSGIHKVGGSVFSLVGAQSPHLLANILPSVAEQGSTVVSTAASGGETAVHGAAALMKVGLPNVDFSTIGKLATSGFSAVVQNAPGILGQAANAVGSATVTAGLVVGTVLNADVGADIANVALNVIGTTAAVFPFLLPLQIALRDIGFAVQEASYNKEAATELGVRCEDCSKIVIEMAPRIRKVCTSDEEATDMLRNFVASVDDCTVELKKFASKGFLSHMFGYKKEGRLLSRLDKRITDSMQALSMRVDGKMMEIQLANNQKLDGLQLLLNGSSAATDVNNIPPEQVADLLQKAGCKSSSEVSSEMQSVGFKLDDIAKGVSSIANKLEKMDAKLDQMDSKLDSMNANISNRLETLLDKTTERNDALELANQRMLDAMKEMNEKLVQIPLAMMRQKTTGNVVQHPEVFSTNNQVEYLAKRADEMKGKCAQVILIHPNGVGKETYHEVHAAPGIRGPDGLSNHRAPDGAMGSSPGADGDDGQDGDDGLDGEEGHDGGDGESAEPFEIMIEFVEEDKEKGVRVYHIEHAGPTGKDDYTLSVPLLNAILLVDGKGGNGGRGGDGGTGSHLFVCLFVCLFVVVGRGDGGLKITKLYFPCYFRKRWSGW
jgi:hypothetical protein